MKKTIIFGLFAMTFVSAAFATQPGEQAAASFNVINDDCPTQFSVQVLLVNSNGTPVSNHGLRGFWARNTQTGEYYYPYCEGDLFEDLPTGTYTFGAINGYWDGASQETITLDCSVEGGYTTVELVYWVE